MRFVAVVGFGLGQGEVARVIFGVANGESFAAVDTAECRGCVVNSFVDGIAVLVGGSLRLERAVFVVNGFAVLVENGFVNLFGDGIAVGVDFRCLRSFNGDFGARACSDCVAARRCDGFGFAFGGDGAVFVDGVARQSNGAFRERCGRDGFVVFVVSRIAVVVGYGRRVDCQLSLRVEFLAVDGVNCLFACRGCFGSDGDGIRVGRKAGDVAAEFELVHARVFGDGIRAVLVGDSGKSFAVVGDNVRRAVIKRVFGQVNNAVFVRLDYAAPVGVDKEFVGDDNLKLPVAVRSEFELEQVIVAGGGEVAALNGVRQF